MPSRYGADVAEDVLRMRAGTAVGRDALQLPLDELPVQVEEDEPVRLQPFLEDVRDERVQGPTRDRPAAEPRDRVVDGDGET